ncbi:actin-binding Rho-activating protein [Python bivittatus]|uniref:Actin-binding Rho-activating protein n=1 Tax=Python bivittatus TaxID=176946 RepID=A0A9F5J7B8_PYTBI|nr:actin-binding Rho-activating protein [Python bivittatus]
MPPEEHQCATPAKRAIKKIRMTSLVISLARGWQQWATEHNTKQAQEPSGWVPNEEKSPNAPREQMFPKHQSKDEIQFPLKQQVSNKDGEQSPRESSEALEKFNIRSKEVTKTVARTLSERSSDIGLLSNKYEKDEFAETGKITNDPKNIDQILSSKVSPTRRRKCSNLVTEMTKGWKRLEQEELQDYRSNSLDTEDSDYAEDTEDRLDIDHNIQEIRHVVRIKHPMASYKNRNIKLSKNYSPVYTLKGRWEEWADEHVTIQKLNPFSEEFDYELAMATRLRKGDEGYGYPKEGTKTAERAKRAEDHIHREMRDLCFIIRTMAQPRRDGKIQVTFGDLFERYVHISDKVVGILMRARKHGMLDFKGEMLWQGRDDAVLITLLE